MLTLQRLPKHLLFTAILSAAAVSSQSTGTELPSDLTGAIPSCLSDCVVSFIGSFPGNNCGSLPSLDCLCQQQDPQNGYTLGEGLVQCSYAVPSCSNGPNNRTLQLQLLSTCQNQPNAIRPSHSVITATIAGPVASVNAQAVSTTSSSTTSSSSQLTSAIQTDTSSAPPAPFPQSIMSSTPTGTPSPSPPPSSGLGNGAIAGIACGGAAIACVAAGCIIFFICLHRRRQSDSSNGKRPGSRKRQISDDEKSLTSFGPPDKSPAFFPTPPQPPRHETTPAWFRPIPQHNGIGLAITPQYNQTPASQADTYRTMSSLLPPKPEYSIAVPPPTKQYNRASTATVFQDLDSDETTLQGSTRSNWSSKSNVAAGAWPENYIGPKVPPKDGRYEPQSYDHTDIIGSYSNPSPEDAPQTRQYPAALTIQTPQSYQSYKTSAPNFSTLHRTPTTASSIYSRPHSRTTSNVPRIDTNYQPHKSHLLQPPPSTYQAYSPAMNHNINESAYRNSCASDNGTDFEGLDSDDEINLDEHASPLSPVLESPQSRTSSVTYPTVPRSRSMRGLNQGAGQKVEQVAVVGVIRKGSLLERRTGKKVTTGETSGEIVSSLNQVPDTHTRGYGTPLGFKPSPRRY